MHAAAGSAPSDLAAVAAEVDATLDRLMLSSEVTPGRLHDAMRYAVFAGGKRVRPALRVLTGESLGGSRDQLLEAAAALEMIHTFSLVHDDLPALDDDDLRRGRPTVHRAFDEALAVLVGDALLNLGLEILATCPVAASAETRCRNVVETTRAVGTVGMIGGQVEDIESEGVWPSDPAATLERIHERKTGALLQLSVRLGGRLAGADEAVLGRLTELGERAGLIFQIRDDLLDLEADAEQLGKTPGKDVEANKLTYPALHGREAARRRIADEQRLCDGLVADLGLAGGPLDGLLRFLAGRDR